MKDVILRLMFLSVVMLPAAEHMFAESDVGRKTETLSRHVTVAVFQGISDYRCLGMTSLCPDRCGQSGALATFKVVRYLASNEAEWLNTLHRKAFGLKP
jgi:hypothetical protein